MTLEPERAAWVVTVRKQLSSTDTGGSAWDVLDAIAPSGGGRAWETLCCLDWCLFFEELGAAGRDINPFRSVHTFLKVLVRDGKDEDDYALRVLQSWVARPGDTPAKEGLASLSEVRLEGEADTAMVDADMLVCAAFAVGIGRKCLEAAQDRAADRTVAGKRLLELQSVSHRLAEVSVSLTMARAGLMRAAHAQDSGAAEGFRAPAAAAACLSAALDCAHCLAQTYGAAGTSDRAVVRLYDAAYRAVGMCGTPDSLHSVAGSRWRVAALAGGLPHTDVS